MKNQQIEVTDNEVNQVAGFMLKPIKWLIYFNVIVCCSCFMVWIWDGWSLFWRIQLTSFITVGLLYLAQRLIEESTKGLIISHKAKIKKQIEDQEAEIERMMREDKNPPKF